MKRDRDQGEHGEQQIPEPDEQVDLGGRREVSIWIANLKRKSWLGNQFEVKKQIQKSPCH